ncbi:HAMP domain-containing histidine kinase [Allokutzneria sp. A3M-2-11 16]|uniref:sensor histidine kinase n=1 Tax=Allokutzneria sp. A3M-2-11 16 TaxID=2962043 RepID=UPI0020B79AC5|nr:HAMP domain-containing sensor histidine kinase [Allokutzneria sp. A3M-2-11 16]MCP3797673.1 HAMP domain-containing histidine kinase [Allokutzneria sp. A3M-2-11 16]
MLRRLLGVLVPLLVVLAAAMGIPLAMAVAEGETQRLYLDRLADASRFASIADNALSSGRTTALRDEMVRYDALYSSPAALVAPGGRIILASRENFDLTAPTVTEQLKLAFAGYRPEPPEVVWPWREAPLVVVEPVGRDSEVVASVVTVSSTEPLRAQIAQIWWLLVLVGVVPLLALVAVAWPISRWVLRPIHQLDEATARVASGKLDTRADVDGPPELRRLAVSFNSMVDVVGRALRRQRAFVADASHQLRNPLASLRLAVENLQPHLGSESNTAARASYEIAVEEAAEMGRVLDALLAATRLDSAAAAEPVELDALVATHEPAWAASALRAEIELHVEIPQGLRALEPPGGLGSVLDELVGNAVRLSGGSEIVVRAERVGDMVELHVIDDGTGLPEDERAAALDRFWRSPRHQNIAGTGLGLAICAELVTAAGGDLELLSPGPHGLDAVVRLPAAD